MRSFMMSSPYSNGIYNSERTSRAKQFNVMEFTRGGAIVSIALPAVIATGPARNVPGDITHFAPSALYRVLALLGIPGEFRIFSAASVGSGRNRILLVGFPLGEARRQRFRRVHLSGSSVVLSVSDLCLD